MLLKVTWWSCTLADGAQWITAQGGRALREVLSRVPASVAASCFHKRSAQFAVNTHVPGHCQLRSQPFLNWRIQA